MRLVVGGLALAALTACGPTLPESGAPNTGEGVGFGNYAEYEADKAKRDAELAGASPVPAAGTISAEGTTSETNLPRTGTSVAQDTLAALDATDQSDLDANSGVPVVHADPANPAPVQTSNPGISDENDFDAVGSRRTIANDAALIAQNREQYQVATVEALPRRKGGGGPNIVEYALTTKHPVGTQVYRRIGIAKESRYRKNCAKYTSSDMAQSAFLDKGGPERDRLGLDPDGDGYACLWNPSPFRKATGG